MGHVEKREVDPGEEWFGFWRVNCAKPPLLQRITPKMT
jgi:hypothetical protein